jgi:hypothetical protein
LNSIDRETFQGTDEEWEESYSYFTEQNEIANLKLQYAKEAVVEMYKNEIGDKIWHINFNDCELRIGTCHSQNVKPSERNKVSYSDTISRLYPPEDRTNYKKYSAKSMTL